MPIEVEIVAGGGDFEGHKSNITTYSYDENSTPHIPGDESGGVGELSFGVREADNSVFLYKSQFVLTDSFNGSVGGEITGVDSTDTEADIRGRSQLARLNTTRSVGAQEVTLEAAIQAILDEAGVTNTLQVDASIASTPVVVPAVNKDLWVFLKELCSAYQFELALVDTTIIARPLRERLIDLTNISSEGWSVSDDNLAQSVEVAYYNYETLTGALVSPKGGWTPDVQVYQVDANQTLVVELPVEAYLTSVEQPSVQLFVAQDYSGPNSVYTIAGNDGLPVQVAQWTDGGGSVTLALKENGTIIEATIVGANIPNLAPFRLAVSSGPSDYYSTLRIVGSGIGFTREIFTKSTGLTIDETSNIIGVTVDNPFIDTLEDARQAAVWASAQFGKPTHTYSATARRVNRSTDAGPVVIYPTFTQWGATQTPGDLFSDFNTDFAGQTFQDFTDAQFATVVNDFDNQAFGNIGGARIRHNDAWFRVRGASTTQDEVSVTAEYDTLVSDFNTEWDDGSDFADFNARWDGRTFTDFALRPLWRTAA